MRVNSDLSIAILGWKSPVTTRHSLETYRAAGLYDCCGEFFIYYNQYSDADRALGEEMGVRTCGGPENLGNWGGQKKILEIAKGDYVLFLENDHPVVTTPEETRERAAQPDVAEHPAEAQVHHHADDRQDAGGEDALERAEGIPARLFCA